MKKELTTLLLPSGGRRKNLIHDLFCRGRGSLPAHQGRKKQLTWLLYTLFPEKGKVRSLFQPTEEAEKMQSFLIPVTGRKENMVPYQVMGLLSGGEGKRTRSICERERKGLMRTRKRGKGRVYFQGSSGEKEGEGRRPVPTRKRRGPDFLTMEGGEGRTYTGPFLHPRKRESASPPTHKGGKSSVTMQNTGDLPKSFHLAEKKKKQATASVRKRERKKERTFRVQKQIRREGGKKQTPLVMLGTGTYLTTLSLPQKKEKRDGLRSHVPEGEERDKRVILPVPLAGGMKKHYTRPTEKKPSISSLRGRGVRRLFGTRRGGRGGGEISLASNGEKSKIYEGEISFSEKEEKVASFPN